jgi:hypothetical protein
VDELRDETGNASSIRAVRCGFPVCKPSPEETTGEVSFALALWVGETWLLTGQTAEGEFQGQEFQGQHTKLIPQQAKGERRQCGCVEKVRQAADRVRYTVPKTPQNSQLSPKLPVPKTPGSPPEEMSILTSPATAYRWLSGPS